MLIKGNQVFHIGDDALTVCQAIVAVNPRIQSLRLIAHDVGINWRQIYKNNQEKVRHVESALYQSVPIRSLEISADEFLKITINNLPQLKEFQVWSIVSKVQCFDGEFRHIPMMNFHPEVNSSSELITMVNRICGYKQGVLLRSGRYFHYYGTTLLDHENWLRFMASFLMPCVIVSPRYIGHRLYAGYCTLRLTSEKIYKPLVPKVIDVFLN